MKILEFIERVIIRIVDVTLVALFFMMLGLAISQVFLRYFFHTGISFADVLTRNLVMWVGFLGAIVATRDNKHFHIDVLTRFLNERQKLWLRSVTNFFSAVVCYFLGRASITFLQFDPTGKVFLSVPASVVGAILPAGFFLMAVLFVVQMIGALVEAFRHRITPESA